VKRRKGTSDSLLTKAGGELDDRFKLAGPARVLLNKVFPDHWSFLLGEIALFSFILLLLSGTFLALFFEPSMVEVTYNGVYVPLQGIDMSRAYESALDISFETRGGLFMRQMHHWATLLFMAAILVHMLRIFFTGAFRAPRETNWMIGIILFWVGFFEGFFGYSLPDDGLSGTGLRIMEGMTESVPFIGPWASAALFRGQFPGTDVISMIYIIHVFIFPLILLGLIVVHVGLVFAQKHTQWPGPGRTEHNVVGFRMFPNYVMKQVGFMLFIWGVIGAMAGLFQINPIWLFGPYEVSVVSSASQPDFYVMYLDGLIRLFPAWEFRVPPYFTLPAVFWPAIAGMGLSVMLPLLYPALERRFTKDRGHHNLLQRPRDNPARTGLGMMVVVFWIVGVISGGNDVFAEKFGISLNAMTWAGRIGLVVLPIITYYVTYRICLGLQQHDREVLAHGLETGILMRDPNGRFYEVHQPLAEPDEHGHTELEYGGWVVPKKMNRVGALEPTEKGFFKSIEEPSENGGAERRDEIESGKH